MDKSRQQFEEWRSKNKSSTINLFDVWKASRESLEVELPDSIEYSKEYRECDYEEGYRKGYNFTILECKQILISNGVKIKNE